MGVFAPFIMAATLAVPTWIPPQWPDGINPDGATATAPAVRVDPPDPPPVIESLPPLEVGLGGAPFAPPGLSDCDEMSFYRQQWNLPAVFDRLGWRESNCLNRDDVHTSCCWGYWQLWISLHLRDHRIAPGYAMCGVDAIDDVNSDNPWDKQRQACAASVLYRVVGMSAW